MDLQELNKRFSSPILSFAEGPGGRPLARLQNEYGSADVALHGAHVLSYEPAGNEPVLWVSQKAIYEDGKAIRGGIPVCWPWFADHPSDSSMPAHGIARTQSWKVIEPRANRHLALQLEPTDWSHSIWPEKFELRLEITLGPALEIRLEAANKSNRPFQAGAALHSYFHISRINAITVHGLENTTFIDKLDNDREAQEADPISFDREIDRIYVETEAACLIRDAGLNRTIRVAKEGSRSTVVWNPWIGKARRMGDFGDDEYVSMVCVETTNAERDVVTIQPGENHVLMARLSIDS
ncbi:MAG: D-hexose-6-phosphate mutarotase [Verrucomicrobiota bacterium]